MANGKEGTGKMLPKRDEFGFKYDRSCVGLYGVPSAVWTEILGFESGDRVTTTRPVSPTLSKSGVSPGVFYFWCSV